MKNYLEKKRFLRISMIVFLLLMTIASVKGFSQQKVKNIVLVHGAFADGSGWEGVYKILVKRGYNVSVVGNPDTGLPDDLEALKRVLDRQDGPVILVGHSYGGAVITEGGTDKNVAGLVFVTAFVPDEGETLLKLSQSGPPSPNSGILPPQNGFLWYDKSKFHSGFCADLSAEKAAFMADAQVPLAASVFQTPITKAAWKTKPSWYVVASQDETIPPDGQRFMAKRANAKVTEVKGSHAVYVSQPAAVADVIEAAAKGALK